MTVKAETPQPPPRALPSLCPAQVGMCTCSRQTSQCQPSCSENQANVREPKRGPPERSCWAPVPPDAAQTQPSVHIPIAEAFMVGSCAQNPEAAGRQDPVGTAIKKCLSLNPNYEQLWRKPPFKASLKESMMSDPASMEKSLASGKLQHKGSETWSWHMLHTRGSPTPERHRVWKC